MKATLFDERDDVARPDHSVRGMRPAHERLDADELSCRRVHLRLELQRERIARDRALQIIGSKSNDGHARRLRAPARD